MTLESQKSNEYITFRCYSKGVGIDEWREGLADEVQSAMDAVLETLSWSPRRTWPETLFEPLHGACADLHAVRIEVPITVDEDNPSDTPDEKGDDCAHWRIIAFEGPNRNEVTLLYGFEETNSSDYGPACRSAQERRTGVEKDGIRRAPKCSFP